MPGHKEHMQYGTLFPIECYVPLFLFDLSYVRFSDPAKKVLKNTTRWKNILQGLNYNIKRQILTLIESSEVLNFFLWRTTKY